MYLEIVNTIYRQVSSLQTVIHEQSVTFTDCFICLQTVFLITDSHTRTVCNFYRQVSSLQTVFLITDSHTRTVCNFYRQVSSLTFTDCFSHLQTVFLITESHMRTVCNFSKLFTTSHIPKQFLFSHPF